MDCLRIFITENIFSQFRILIQEFVNLSIRMGRFTPSSRVETCREPCRERSQTIFLKFSTFFLSLPQTSILTIINTTQDNDQKYSEDITFERKETFGVQSRSITSNVSCDVVLSWELSFNRRKETSGDSGRLKEPIVNSTPGN